MAFLDFLRRPPAEPIFAVPIATRPLGAGTAGKTYVCYAFLFAASADAAVARLHGAIRAEGHEILQLTGPVLVTSLSGWTDFVAEKFDWLRDALPTARQLGAQPRSRVYYSPRIVQS